MVFVYTWLCSKWRHISNNILLITGAKNEQMNNQDHRVCDLCVARKSLWYLICECLILHVEIVQDVFMRSDLHGQNISLKRIPHFSPFCLQTRRFLCRINRLLKKQKQFSKTVNVFRSLEVCHIVLSCLGAEKESNIWCPSILGIHLLYNMQLYCIGLKCPFVFPMCNQSQIQSQKHCQRFTFY